MLKNTIYAVLLGVGMAACLSQSDQEPSTGSGSTTGSATLPDTAAVADASTTLALRAGQAGPVQLGQDITRMREQVPASLTLADTTLMQEGMQSTAYTLKPANQPKGLLVEQRCQNNTCTVWRITVLHPDFKTSKGMGVGSKFGEVRQAHAIERITFEEGNLLALAPKSRMSFILDKSQFPELPTRNLAPTDLPENILVSKILLY